MKAYLEYVRTEARPFYDREMPVLEACKRIDLGPYADWTEPERLIHGSRRGPEQGLLDDRPPGFALLPVGRPALAGCCAHAAAKIASPGA